MRPSPLSSAPPDAPAAEAGTVALVENPTQLLNVVELVQQGDGAGAAAVRVAVLAPGAGRTRDELRAVVALARQEGLAVTWQEPRTGGASVARTLRGLLDALGPARRLVLGDPFSGLAQVLVGLLAPAELVVVDDGATTLELARRLGAGEGLHRRLVRGGATRLRLFTCLPLDEVALRPAGVAVDRNAYAWTRRRWCAPEVQDGVDLVGSPVVPAGAVDAGSYLSSVTRLVEDLGVTRYLADRRETEATLAQVRALGVEVVRPALPLEAALRRGPVAPTVVCFPSAAVHTLPAVLAGTGVLALVCAVPDRWRVPAVDRAATALLRRRAPTDPVGGVDRALTAVAC